MTTREEAAAEALRELWDEAEPVTAETEAEAALAAADAHDADHNIHRLDLGG